MVEGNYLPELVIDTEQKIGVSGYLGCQKRTGQILKRMSLLNAFRTPFNGTNGKVKLKKVLFLGVTVNAFARKKFPVC
jgi:hypothetical protein